MAERMFIMTNVKVTFDALSAVEVLKKDVRTNAERQILDMVGQCIWFSGWHDASEWSKMKYRIGDKSVFVVLRSGTVTTEAASWLETDANNRLFRKYEKDRVLYFMPMPEAPEVPEAENEDEDVFVETAVDEQ